MPPELFIEDTGSSDTSNHADEIISGLVESARQHPNGPHLLKAAQDTTLHFTVFKRADRGIESECDFEVKEGAILKVLNGVSDKLQCCIYQSPGPFSEVPWGNITFLTREDLKNFVLV